MAHSGFSGVYAPASLKAASASPVRSVARAGFFRGLCPGLIEGGPQLVAIAISVTGFSGVYAPASLKADVLGHVSAAPRGGFSGVYAPASLKVPAKRLAIGGGTRFFRGLCPGLIEAAWLPPLVRSSSSVFPGFMPRPH